ncbi:LytTR family transcriptional regulator DNA-binding domain-containing protein [Maribellus maritimus]|nr:LytTR family transcriptional regulator DNA-binding domain-containing protein [Maribellus maritimus]
MSALAEKLPGLFLRIHRSFIVNKEKITCFNIGEVELNDVLLIIRRSYKQ